MHSFSHDDRSSVGGGAPTIIIIGISAAATLSTQQITLISLNEIPIQSVVSLICTKEHCQQEILT